MAAISDTLDTGVSGWTSSNGDLSWDAANGDLTGVLNQFWKFVAPSKYLDDLSDRYGATISFDQSVGHQGFEVGGGDVFLTGGGLSLYNSVTGNPSTEATTYSFKLEYGQNWNLSGQIDRIATEAEIRTVLDAVTALELRGDQSLANGLGYASTTLDNVSLSDGMNDQPRPIVTRHYVLSEFDEGVDGWTSVDDAVSFTNEDGTLKVADSGDGVQIIAAPGDYLGSKDAFYDGYFQFTLTTSLFYGFFDSVDLVIAGSAETIVYRDPDFHPRTVTHRIETNAQAGWRVDSATGELATEQQMRNALADVESLTLNLDFRGTADDFTMGYFFALRGNQAPEIQLESQTVGIGEWRRLSEVLQYSDLDGDPAASFRLNDVDIANDTQGGLNFWADGGTAARLTTVETSDPSEIWFRGDTVAGTQTLWVQASDGQDRSEWTSFQLTTIGDNPPDAVMDDQYVLPNVWVRLSDVISYDDIEGDVPTRLHIWDSTGINNWWADGAITNASSGYQTSDPAGVWFRSDAQLGEQTMWVRAGNDTEWGAWESFTLNTSYTSPNHPPTVEIGDLWAVTNSWIYVSDLISTSDPDGDSIVSYTVWDDEGGNNWWVDGIFVNARNGYTVDADRGIWLRADAVAGSQQLWIQADDGPDKGEWHSFTFTALDAPNTPPVAGDLAFVTYFSGGPSLAPRFDLISQSFDADGDDIEFIEVWEVSDQLQFVVDGVFVQGANGARGHVLTPDQKLRLALSPNAAADGFFFRVSDGQDWSAWDHVDVLPDIFTG